VIDKVFAGTPLAGLLDRVKNNAPTLPPGQGNGNGGGAGARPAKG
jgi:hypothetical protein